MILVEIRLLKLLWRTDESLFGLVRMVNWFVSVSVSLAEGQNSLVSPRQESTKIEQDQTRVDMFRQFKGSNQTRQTRPSHGLDRFPKVAK